MSERIDHYAAAVGMLKDAQAAQDLSMVGIIAQGAQVHATLALVEQQRVANLIALAGYEHANGSRSYQYAVARPVNEFDLALNDEIKEALGL